MTAEVTFSVDLKKLDKFIAEKTKTAKCPFCHSEDWTIPTSGEVALGAIPWGQIDGSMYMVGLPVVTMICKNCFFVRMMAIYDPGVKAALGEAEDAK
ncbi:hypothetical protein ACU684_09545 [Pseudomonas sp. LF135]